MVTNYRHITGFFALLICVSLSLSSIHNHEVYTFNSSDQHTAVSHTLDSDASLCPICGYLFHTDAPSENAVEGIIREQSVVRVAQQQRFVHTDLSGNQNRAPPFQV